MVPMRDGVRLAFDVYRPGRRRSLRRGPLPGDHAPHAVRQGDEALHGDRRLLRPARLRRRARRHARPLPLRGLGHVLPLGDAAHRQRRLRHRRVDRGAAVEQRPRRHRRQLVRGPGADPHGARAATAPDRDLARRGDDEQLRQLHPARAARCRGTCSGRSSSTPRTPRRCATIRRSPSRSGTTCRNLRELYRATPWQRGQTSLRLVPALEQTLIDYYTRGAYDDWWARIECDFTALLRPACRRPDDRLVGLVRSVGGPRRRLLRRDGGAEHGARSGS